MNKLVGRARPRSIFKWVYWFWLHNLLLNLENRKSQLGNESTSSKPKDGQNVKRFWHDLLPHSLFNINIWVLEFWLSLIWVQEELCKTNLNVPAWHRHTETIHLHKLVWPSRGMQHSGEGITPQWRIVVSRNRPVTPRGVGLGATTNLWNCCQHSAAIILD